MVLKTKIRDVVSICIFCIFTAVAVLLVRPAYRNLVSGVASYARGIKTDVEDTLSMKISYKSLSPSILSSVSIREITLTSLDGEKVASINKIRLEYKLFKLIKGDFANGFKSLVVDGVDISGRRLMDLISSMDFAKQQEEKEKNPEKNIIDLNIFHSDFPLSILFKNIHVSYSDKDVTVDASIRKMNVDFNNKKRQLVLQADTFASGKYRKQAFSGNVNVEGKVFDGFENSSANITVSNLTDGNIKLNRISLLLGYKSNELSVTTIKNSFPLGLRVSFDMESGLVEGEAKAENLTVASIIQVNKKNEIFKLLEDLKISTDTRVSYSTKEGKLQYETETSAFIPEKIVPGGGDALISLSGDEKKVSVSSVSLLGENYDVSGDLEFIFQGYNLTGYLNAEKVQIPQGPVISGEIYFDPLSSGFMAFIPQLFIDETQYTALQLTASPKEDSLDFFFEGFDYSHFEADEPGRISADGSYLFSDHYLQTSLAANSFFLDTVMNTAASFVPESTKNTMESVSSSVKDYMFSADAYFSTDFSSVSYNVPYVLLANTKAENQALLVSLDGNEASVGVTQFDLIFGKYALHVTGSLDVLPGTKDMFVLMDLNTGDVPYHFAGTIANNVVDLSGDYNTSVRMDYSQSGLLKGNVSFENLPVLIQNISIVSTLESNMIFSEQDGFEINLTRFEVEEAGSTISANPHLVLGGNINRYGARLDSIVYSDLYSELDGAADIFFAMDESILDSAGMTINMKNPLSEESFTLQANVSNPMHLPFSADLLKNEFYLDVSAQTHNLDMNRFTKIKSNNNVLSAGIYVGGTLEHPYVSAGLEKLSILAGSDVLRMSGSAVMENHDITLNELLFDYGPYKINQVSGNFSLDTFDGMLSANVDMDVLEDNLHVPFILETKDAQIEKGKIIPSSFRVSLKSDNVYGTFLKKETAFSILADVSKDGINILTSENMGLFASYRTTGELFATLDTKSVGSAVFNGAYDVKSGALSGKLDNVNLDVSKAFGMINFDKYVIFKKGTVTGSLTVGGTLDTPLLTGAMSLSNPEFTIPYVEKEIMHTDKFLVTFVNGEIVIPERKVFVKKNREFFASCRIIFDKWRFDRLESKVRTEKGQYIPVEIAMGMGMSVTGEANFNLDLLLMSEDFEITGDVLAENAEYSIALPKMLAALNVIPPEPQIYTNVDLKINMGTHVRINVDPLLRAIFVPGGKLDIIYDQHTGNLSMNGILILKSGDVSYLNRNFYIKEGLLKFSPSDMGFNPMINVRAETRERDDSGDTVTISLNAQNQHIREFDPNFTSVPAKSDIEIQRLLGQIVVADSENVGNFIFAAGDYAFQSLVGRKFENKLRDFLNFDIFSLRTNIIQNTLNYSLSDRAATDVMKAGNFLDNSTVYIGKYLGSAIYVDAMLNIQYDEKRIQDTTTLGGILFRPEFGVEMESPFGNIRWNVAPDIDAMMHKQYVPASSISLSWKFSF